MIGDTPAEKKKKKKDNGRQTLADVVIRLVSLTHGI